MDALVVPTVFDADQKSLGQIARDARAVIGKVKDKTVTPPELSGGTFTVSNLGMFGIEQFTAIINPPQAAILTVGQAREEAGGRRQGQADRPRPDGAHARVRPPHPLRRRRRRVPRPREGPARAAAVARAVGTNRPSANAVQVGTRRKIDFRFPRGGTNLYFPSGGKGEPGWPASRECRPSSLRGRMPREPRTLDEEIIAAQEAAVRSTLTDEDRIERISAELRMGFDALAGVGAAASFFGSARTPPDDPEYALARETARMVGESGMAIITGGGPGSWRRRTAARRTPARCRSGSTSSCRSSRALQHVLRHRARVPLLLHAQDHVRPLRERVRGLPRRVRHARRAVRGAHADPDRQDPSVPGRAGRDATTGAGWSTGSASGCWPRATSRPRTSSCDAHRRSGGGARPAQSAVHRQARA